MASLTFHMNILYLIFAAVIIGTHATNNTTQFDNFTIEWEDFSLLTCVVSSTYTVSLFSCPIRNGTIIVQDISCLDEMTIDFNGSTCQPSTTEATSASSTIVSTQPTETSMVSTSMTTTITTTTTSSTIMSSTTTTSTSTSTTITTTTSWTTTQTTTTTSTSSLPTTFIESTTVLNTLITDGRTVGSTVVTSSSITSMTTGSSMSSSNMPAIPEITTTRTTTTTANTTTSNGMYNCSNNYIGTHCNISSDACAMAQPCQNAATCFPNNTIPQGYICVCQTGFEGYDCQWDVRPCRDNTCWHNGTCIPINSTISGNNGSNFLCLCTESYNGVYCELEINLCDKVTCENRGVCQMNEMTWECLCLDSSLYYGDYCQYKTNRLKVREIISKSFASVAIGAIVTTCSFVIIMDVLKYAFRIDPAEHDRDSYRRRRERQRRARRPVKHLGPTIALRFQYIS